MLLGYTCTTIIYLYVLLYVSCTPQEHYAAYAKLRHRSNVLVTIDVPTNSDIAAHTDYLDSVYRNFAVRLEQRQDLLVLSVRFHRIAEEVRC